MAEKSRMHSGHMSHTVESGGRRMPERAKIIPQTMRDVPKIGSVSPVQPNANPGAVGEQMGKTAAVIPSAGPSHKEGK